MPVSPFIYIIVFWALVNLVLVGGGRLWKRSVRAGPGIGEDPGAGRATAVQSPTI